MIFLSSLVICTIILLPKLLVSATDLSLQHGQAIIQGQAELRIELTSHPDIVEDYFPNKEEVEEYESYRYSPPGSQDYRISLLVNPCGYNSTREDNQSLGYDCCINRFGYGEYSYSPGTRNRFSDGYSNGIPISVDEPLHNIDLVDEYGNELNHKHSRRADDILYIDEACTGLRNPHANCVDDRYAAKRSPMVPPCSDYNHTVDSTLDCFTIEGKRSPNCMQVAYAQSAHIATCGGKFANDEQCGTYFEIHRPIGSPYDDEKTILSTTKLDTPVVNGMFTTTLSLTYKNDASRILCSYEDQDITIGSMVRINSKAPSCCCPVMLSTVRTSKVGAFFCPKRQSNEGGPFAPVLDESLDEQYADDKYQKLFPYCPELPADEDDIMCTQERSFTDIPKTDSRYYSVRPCSPLIEVEDGGSYSSSDLSGVYSDSCPLSKTFQACGLAFDEGCGRGDHHFTFKDKIGKVTHIPDNSEEDKYGVSFNDGRSVYWFARSELVFLKPPFNYQIWYVQRNRGEKIIQKTKPFRVSWPRCTFDSINGRYFPYAQLDDVGHPVVAI